MRQRSDAGGSAARRSAPILAAAALLSLPAATAVELTGRAALLGTALRPSAGDVGHDDPDIGTPTADQQSLRLMLDDHGGDAEWSLHLNAARQHLRGIAPAVRHSSDLFRWRPLAGDDLSQDDGRRSTRLSWEIDRAAYKRRFGKVSVSLGRQPVDWGAGRFWQPLNVFGAFAPTDLDTDYKPGIDAAVVDWYPSDFSSVSAVHALAPRHGPRVDDSTAVHYRRAVGESSQLSLVAGRVIGNTVAGAAFESDWRGIGWRIEGLHSRIRQTGENALFWIAGADYQFGNGTLVSLEWHDNGRGATSEAALARTASDLLVDYGLQQQRSRRVLGFSLQKDLTPLVRAGYTLLAGRLEDAAGGHARSLLHQVNVVYSLSNESDLLISLAYGSGKGLDGANRPRSEFGHIPMSATLRWRFYF